VLLDTHVWIWAVDGGSRLGRKIRRRLDRASRAGVLTDSLYVSAASAFEISALHTAGRLQFNRPVDRWIRESIEIGGLRVLEVDRDIAIDAGQVPRSALPDPIDRVLVATARDRDVPLVTCDQRILDYSKTTGLVETVDGRR